MIDYSTDGDAVLLDEAISLLAALRARQRADLRARQRAKPAKTWGGRSRKLSDEDMASIRVQRRFGFSYAELASMFNVSKPTITAVVGYTGAYK